VRTALRHDGVIAVDQPFDETVVLFGRGGEKLSEVGRHGEGPGEFVGINGMGWTGDTLWVWDARLRRLTRFSPPVTASSASLDVRTSPVAQRSGPGRSNDLDIPAFGAVDVRAVYSGGDILAEMVLPDVPDGSQSRDTVLYARMTADGSVEQVLARVHRQPEEVRVLWTAEARLAFGAPWVLNPSVAVSGDGRLIAVVTPTYDDEASVQSFEVTMLDGMSGDTLYDRHHPFDATLIPRAAADSAIDARTRTIAVHDANFPDVYLVARYRREVTVPRIYPPFGAALLGLDGRLWIHRMEQGQSGTGSYLVLDREGGLAGEVMLQAGVLAAGTGSVWRAVRDDYGVPSLIRYETPWPEGGYHP